MFGKPPKFFDVNDVINFNGEETIIKPKEKINKTKLKEEIILKKDTTHPVVTEPKVSKLRVEKDFIFKYAGDDIPWIF